MRRVWLLSHPYQAAALALMVLTVLVIALVDATAAVWAVPLLLPGIAVGLVQVLRMLQPPAAGR